MVSALHCAYKRRYQYADKEGYAGFYSQIRRKKRHRQLLRLSARFEALIFRQVGTWETVLHVSFLRFSLVTAWCTHVKQSASTQLITERCHVRRVIAEFVHCHQSLSAVK